MNKLYFVHPKDEDSDIEGSWFRAESDAAAQIKFKEDYGSGLYILIEEPKWEKLPIQPVKVQEKWIIKKDGADIGNPHAEEEDTKYLAWLLNLEKTKKDQIKNRNVENLLLVLNNFGVQITKEELVEKFKGCWTPASNIVVWAGDGKWEFLDISFQGKFGHSEEFNQIKELKDQNEKRKRMSELLLKATNEISQNLVALSQEKCGRFKDVYYFHNDGGSGRVTPEQIVSLIGRHKELVLDNMKKWGYL